MEQGLLFQAHSPTSRAAAEAFRGKRLTKRMEVYRFLLECGAYGATDEEIQDGLYMRESTERPRRVELLRDGLIREKLTKERECVTRQTKSGNQAQVWVVA